MPHGCVICIPVALPLDGHWCISMPKANIWYSRMLYIHSAWGFLKLLVSIFGQLPEPLTVKRATMQGFTSFLYLYLSEKRNHSHDYQYRLALAVKKRHEAD